MDRSEIKRMSLGELHEIVMLALDHAKEIEEEGKKAAYELRPVKNPDTVDFQKLVGDIRRHYKYHCTLGKDEFEVMLSTRTSRRPHINDEIYPCPRCGQMTLFASYENIDDWFNSYQIKCTNCEFEAPQTESCLTEESAWMSFHEWLVKNNFIKGRVLEYGE